MATFTSVQGQGEIPNERFLYVNGILTAPAEAEEVGELISWLHGGVNVHCVVDPTQGLVGDLVSSGALMIGMQTEASERVARTARDLFRQMEAETPGAEHTIHIFSHSKGGLTTENALNLP